jgi:16S rRNA (adenine(1408)-N(1))-methyltransferase
MTITRVIGKDRTEAITRADLDARRRDAVRTVIDVGTGDGRYPYALATEHEDWFVIGVDALDEPMGEIAYKAGRKPAKGGRTNVVFLRGAVEQLREQLGDIADEVQVLLPWGRLLEGIVAPDTEVIAGLAALGPRLHVVLNGEIWEASLPVRFEHLPVPTPEYVADVIAPGFAACDVAIGGARYLTAAEAKTLPTTWARRLGHNRDHPRFVSFDGERRMAR